MSTPAGIDPRGPRFTAGITSVLLLIAVVLGLLGVSTRLDPQSVSFLERLTDPGFLLLTVIALLFVWGVLAPRTQPWSVLFRKAVAPRLTPSEEREDPRPPRFAQGVGLFVTALGLLLHLVGVPWALPIAATAAFIAAFLNAVFGLCLGCEIYLLLQRVRFRRTQTS